MLPVHAVVCALLSSLLVLLVADLFQPLDILAIHHIRDRDMAHTIGSEAPCQCLTPGGVQITSPGLISRLAPPSSCTHPVPEVTIRSWPAGCVCQAERAPGANVTRPPAAGMLSFASNRGSRKTD